MTRTLTAVHCKVRLQFLLLAAAALVSCGGGDAGGDGGAPRGQQQMQFAQPVPLEYAQSAIAMAIGDVDGDGIADVLMTANAPTGVTDPYALFFFAGRSDGSLAPALRITGASMPAGCYLTSIAVGDVNGDGRNDVVVGSQLCGAQIFLQSATSALVAGPYIDFAGFEIVRIVDIDGDGRADVVGVTMARAGAVVLRQDATGTLVLQTPIALGNTGATDVEVGDVNGDGLSDLVIAIGGLQPPQQIAVLLQQVGGGFSAPQFLSTQSTLRPLAVAIGDLDGDGRNDVAVTSGGNSPTNVTVFYQGSDGTLGRVARLETFDVPAAVRIADINGDGRADLIVTHSGWFAVGIYLHQSDGTLAAEQRVQAPYVGGLSPQLMAVGDVNRDGLVDIVIAGTVLLQKPPAILAAQVTDNGRTLLPVGDATSGVRFER